MGKQDAGVARPRNVSPRAGQAIRGSAGDLQAISPAEVQARVRDLVISITELEGQVEELGKAQRQLERYRDRYVPLYDDAPLGYVTLDADGYVQEINRTGASMLGVEPDEVIGYAFVEYVLAGDVEEFLRHVGQCVGNHAEPTSEIALATRGGRSIPVQLHSLPITDPDGEATLCNTAITDISERRRMEEGLRKSQAFLQTVIDAVPEALSVIDRDYRVVLANRAARELAGSSDASSSALLCHQLLGERGIHCRPPTPCPLRSIVQSKAPIVLCHTHRDAEGQPVYVEVHAAPILDANGEVVQIVELRRDITPRRRAEEERYQRLLQAVTSYTYSVALENGRPASTTHSPECLAATGYSAEEYASNPHLWLSMVHPEDRELVLGQVERVCQGDRAPRVEHRILHKDGSIRWVSSTVVPQYDTSGGVARYDGVVEDITERKLAQVRLETDLQIQKALRSILQISLAPITLEQMLERTLDSLFSVPFIALESKGAVFLADNEQETLVMTAHRGLPSELQECCRKVPFGCCLCGRAAAGEKIVFADCIDERHGRQHPGMIPHGHFCVPIVSGERLLGVMNLYVRTGHERTESEDLFLASVADILAGTIGRHAAEHSLRATQAELIAAERMQKSLVPRAPPDWPGYDVYGALIPAEYAAGDYFDYLNMADGSFAIVLADVSGHGVSAALAAAFLQARIQTLSEVCGDIDRILARANSALARDVQEGRFVTAILIRIDPRTRALSYVSAGHPSGYVIRPDGTMKETLQSMALPLAVTTDAEFPAGGPVLLEPGDAVVLLTDGILEASARDGTLFGANRTIEVLTAARGKSAREMVDTLFAAASGFTGRERPDDDMTAAVLKVRHGCTGPMPSK